MRKSNINLAPSLLLVFSLTISVLNAQVSWDGGASNSLWGDPLNWSLDAVPTASDDVAIGAVTVDINGFVAAAKSVTLTGSTLKLNATGILQINIGGTYALTLDGASVTNDGSIEITNCSGGIGLQGAGSTLTNTGGISVDNFSGVGLTFISGSSGGSVVNANSLSFDNGTNANAAAILYQQSAGTITNSGTLTIGSTAHAGPGINFGIIGGTFNNTGTVTIANTGAGKVGLNSGFIPGTLNNNSGGIFNLNTGIGGNWLGGFNLNLKNDGVINLNVPGAVDLVASGTGTFAGTNEFSTINKVAPGNSAGCLTFSSGYSNSGNTTIEIGGTAACTQHDKINVTGTATISGSLTVSLINGFTPTAGQTFTLLEATNLSGTYSPVSYPTVSNISWTTSYTSTSVIANANSSLPVELSHFSAKLNEDEHVELAWRTASEHNNEGFFIEKSRDGRAWGEIGFVAGQGSSFAERSYFFLDKKPTQGMNYFRLRQMDFDGKQELSKVVSVDFTNREDLSNLSIFPNPTTGPFGWKGGLPEGTAMQVFDCQGRLVKQLTTFDAHFIDLSGFDNGIYSVLMTSPQKTISGKVLKQD